MRIRLLAQYAMRSQMKACIDVLVGHNHPFVKITANDEQVAVHMHIVDVPRAYV